MSSERPVFSVGLEEFCFVSFPMFPSPSVLAEGAGARGPGLADVERRRAPCPHSALMFYYF